jgi:ribose 5-phosphate isomerase B
MIKLYIASDHAGFELKKSIVQKYSQIQWIDLGPSTADRVDYPDYADRLCTAIHSELKSEMNAHPLGILICGSGVGVSIAANRHTQIRAVLAESTEVARLGREHNHANVLCLGARIISTETAFKILDAFLKATPDLGERHVHRVQLLSKTERPL